jgi:hypothetical protein
MEEEGEEREGVGVGGRCGTFGMICSEFAIGVVESRQQGRTAWPPSRSRHHHGHRGHRRRRLRPDVRNGPFQL